MSAHSQRLVEGCLKHTLRSWGHSDPHFLSVSRSVVVSVYWLMEIYTVFNTESRLILKIWLNLDKVCSLINSISSVLVACCAILL